MRGLSRLVVGEGTPSNFDCVVGSRIGTGKAFAGFDVETIWRPLQDQVDRDVLNLGTALQFMDDMREIGGVRIAANRFNRYRTGMAVSLCVARPAIRSMGLDVVLDFNPCEEAFTSCKAYGLMVNSVPSRCEFSNGVPPAGRFHLARVSGEMANRTTARHLPGDVTDLLGIVAATTATLGSVARPQNGGMA